MSKHLTTYKNRFIISISCHDIYIVDYFDIIDFGKVIRRMYEDAAKSHQSLTSLQLLIEERDTENRNIQQILIDKMKKHNNVQIRVAEELGVSRQILNVWLKNRNLIRG